MRTGAEYREALRDGRRVWVVGEGAVEDVTTHPATRAMVDGYGAWHGRRFLTFAGGGATIGYRLRDTPADRVALRLVRETDGGVVIAGKIGMHTSPVFAEDVYVGSLSGIDLGPHRATFAVPINAPGVTILCRKIAARHANPFLAPLSSRFDELDGQMWLDDVFIPWERVFLTGPVLDPVASWLFRHQLYRLLSQAEL